MSALFDIVVTFIAAMVSAAFVHFGAHSVKPRPVKPPVEQSQPAYEPAQYETVTDEMAIPESPSAPESVDSESYQARVDAKVEAEQAAIQVRIDTQQASKAQQAHDSEIRMRRAQGDKPTKAQ